MAEPQRIELDEPFSEPRPAPDERDINTLDEAMVLLDEWVEYTRELERDHARLMWRYIRTKRDLAYALDAIDNSLFVEQFKRINGDLWRWR